MTWVVVGSFLSGMQDVPAVRAVVDYMLARCPKKQRGDFEKVLQAPSTGLLLNERMVRWRLAWVPRDVHRVPICPPRV